MEHMDQKRIPRHIAIIMDGNGRWARQRGLDRICGHIQGVESVRKVVRAAADCGVEYLTIYAFSTENWGRPSREVEALMKLLCESTEKETPALLSEGIRMRFIGDTEALSADVQEAIRRSEKTTADNTGLTLQIAVNYSSRWEITRMAQRVAAEAVRGGLKVEDITPEVISGHLVTAGVPDPDLLIRTSGERRLSNFLLWQLSYSERYFTDVYWPDFDEQEFARAIEDYQQRQRRYGLLTE